MGLRQQVTNDIAGLPLAKQLINFRPLIHGLSRTETGHRRNKDRLDLGLAHGSGVASGLGRT